MVGVIVVGPMSDVAGGEGAVVAVVGVEGAIVLGGCGVGVKVVKR